MLNPYTIGADGIVLQRVGNRRDLGDTVLVEDPQSIGDIEELRPSLSSAPRGLLDEVQAEL